MHPTETPRAVPDPPAREPWKGCAWHLVTVGPTLPARPDPAGTGEDAP